MAGGSASESRIVAARWKGPIWAIERPWWKIRRRNGTRTAATPLQFVPMRDRPKREVVFLDLTLKPLGAQHHAALVRLRRHTSTVVGAGEAPTILRAAAQGTLEALHRMDIVGADTVQVLEVETLEAFDTTVVGAALSAYGNGKGRLLMGFSRIHGSAAASAAARAVLAATNRFLGTG